MFYSTVSSKAIHPWKGRHQSRGLREHPEGSCECLPRTWSRKWNARATATARNHDSVCYTTVGSDTILSFIPGSEPGMTRKIIILWNAPKNIIKAVIKEWSYLEKKRQGGRWTSEPTAHSCPARLESAKDWSCGGYSLLLRQGLIVRLEKSKQSDCGEKAGAASATFKLGSA